MNIGGVSRERRKSKINCKKISRYTVYELKGCCAFNPNFFPDKLGLNAQKRVKRTFFFKLGLNARAFNPQILKPQKLCV